MGEFVETVEEVEQVSVDDLLGLLTQDAELSEYKEQINSLAPRVKEFYEGSQIGGIEESSELPEDSVLFVFGDIHARNNSLAKVIKDLDKSCRNNGTSLEEKLDSREAVFVFVGDYVHSETNEDSYQKAQREEEKKKLREENLNTVIALFEMKLRFPNSVFMVKGNHDSFATKPGVIKFDLDQGETLKKAVSEEGLDKPLNEMLNILPLVTKIPGPEDRLLLVSHTLPIGTYNGKTLNIKTDLTDYINKADEIVTQLFTWSTVRSPNRDSKVKKGIYNYLMSLISNTLGKNGKKTPLEKISWVVGHQRGDGISGNFAESLVKENPRGLRLFQINNPARLPVLMLRAKSIDKASAYKENNLVRV